MRVVRFVGVRDHTEQFSAEPALPPCHTVFTPSDNRLRFHRIADPFDVEGMSRDFGIKRMLIKPYTTESALGRYRASRVHRGVMDTLCVIQGQPGENSRRLRGLHVQASFRISAGFFADPGRGRATTASCAAATTVCLGVNELRRGHIADVHRWAPNKICAARRISRFLCLYPTHLIHWGKRPHPGETISVTRTRPII